MEIQELIKNRQEFVDAQNKNGFDLSTVLVGLYPDSSHFIYEILQNTEDVLATEIIFSLYDDKLLIEHNGVPFSSSDIDAITGISNLNNNKKINLESIGKFGIGFKSVYAITASPRIQSGKYDFEVRNLVLPCNFSDNNSFHTTIITLPFNTGTLSKEETFDIIKNKFQTFETYNLLFLSNLKSIVFKWDEETKYYSKKEKLISDDILVFDTTISDGVNQNQYLVFKSEVKNENFSKLKNKLKIAIAFKYTKSEGVFEILKPDSSFLFAFFETNYETFLNFLIQAPFTTTPARDNIDLKLSVNIALLDEICELTKLVLDYFRKKKLMSINLLQHLPINNAISSSKIVYHKLFKTIKEEFSSGKKLLPSKVKGLYRAANELAIVRGKELSNLIANKDDMEKLFNRNFWMDTGITVDRTPQLLSYLKNDLDIKEFDSEDFAKRITLSFIQSKNDDWVRRFYEFLNYKQESLWREGNRSTRGILRMKPIIRLINNSHMPPFNEDGKAIVFLPLKKGVAKLSTIKPEVIKSKASLSFVKNKLGIKEPDIFDSFKHQILPIYHSEHPKVSAKDHLAHMQIILEIFRNSNYNQKKEITEIFTDKELRFFHVFDNKTGEVTFQNYQNTYIPIESLKLFFRFSSGINFFNTSEYKKLDENLLIQFLKHCKVQDYPWFISFDPNFKEENLKQLRIAGNYGESRKTYWYGEKVEDYRLEGLIDFLNQPKLSKEDSLLVWNMLTKSIQQPDSRRLFEGKYTWYYYSPHTKTFKCSILKLLQLDEWLYSKSEDNTYKPGELTVNDISDMYDKTSEESGVLIEKLKFMSKAENLFLNQMPEEKRELFSEFEKAFKLCEEQGIDMVAALNKFKDDAVAEKERLEMEATPDIDSVEIVEEEFEEFDDSNVEVGEIEAENNDDLDNKDDRDSGQPKKKRNQSQKMRNFVGAKGEEIVFLFLKKKWAKNHKLIFEDDNQFKFQNSFGEIFTLEILNTDEKKGTGCDILIKKGDEIFEYIEVKATKLDDKDLFPVNGYQWSLAFNKYRQGIGNRYYFYVVKNALSDKPKVSFIKNPIKLWKDGKLRAHPVNLEL